MSEWKSGHFEREKVSTVFRSFTPARAVESLDAIDLNLLHEQGKRLLLLDVDNTIVAWKQENFSPSVLDWIGHAKTLGFDICIISNTRRLERLGRIREMLGVETVRGRFKPSRAMYRLALIKFSRRREEAVMIGDQMMTDIFGANRSGIDAIWVRQMETKEFGPTKINRMVERLLTSAVYKALVVPEDSIASDPRSPVQREITAIQQIFRFGVVGGTSFLIDAGLTALLISWRGAALGAFLLRTEPSLFQWASSPVKASGPILTSVAALVAIFNSFVWNRSWTFEARGKGRRSTQFVRFYIVSLLGVCLNAFIFATIFNLLPGEHTLLAKAISALIVAVWNFVGMRVFVFRASPS